MWCDPDLDEMGGYEVAFYSGFVIVLFGFFRFIIFFGRGNISAIIPAIAALKNLSCHFLRC
jgi:hypothetical protein